MNDTTYLFLAFGLPIVAGLLTFIPFGKKGIKELFTVLVTLLNLLLSLKLFNGSMQFSIPWAGFGIEFSFRLYHFSSFILAASAGFAFLITIYSTVFMSGKRSLDQFYSYILLTLGLVNGAVLANNLVCMIFFWEGLLLTLYGFIAIGQKGAYKTATKAFIIAGICDLCLMFGAGLAYHLSGTLDMSSMKIPLDGAVSSAAFVLLMIGAIAKAGSMPFHSWIPDAAKDAPLPFMAFLPASLEKLLGIYLLARITLDLFIFTPSSFMSPLLMTIGAITILLAVMMALIQKDFKKLLSYHAISQVGYMMLGIGTALPIGIVGGLFHMINHAMYKSCLFLTGGSVEKQAGTTDLEQLGGIGRKMPLTFISFIIAACAISGVPPLNGFFSKELVYEGALMRHWIFYGAALAGSFLTAASFLKLGHSAFMGPLDQKNSSVKEAPLAMIIPMATIALLCIFFGVYNAWPIKTLISPILAAHLTEGHVFSGMPHNIWLVVGTLIVLAAAYLNHLFGVKKTGEAIGAVDHIHYAPFLHKMYDLAEKRFFDPYDIGLKIVDIIAQTAYACDRAIDWVYNVFFVQTAYYFSRIFRALQNGSHSHYIVLALFGTTVIFAFMLFL